MLKWLFLFLLMSISVYPQWKAGGEVTVGIGNPEIDIRQYGIGFIAQYTLEDLPAAVEMNARFSEGSELIFEYRHTILGGRVLYFPFEKKKYDPKPFLAAGLLYNWYFNDDQHGMNTERYINHIENTMSMEFSVGFNLNPLNRNTNYIFEVAYSYNKPWYQYKLGPRYYLTNNGQTYRDRFNFSSVLFRIGVLFRY